MDDEKQPDEATREAERVDAGHSHAADRLPTGEEESAADRALKGLAEDREEVAEHYEEMSDIGAHVKGEGSIDERANGPATPAATLVSSFFERGIEPP